MDSGGDFNEIMFSEEKWGGSRKNPKQMDEFKNVIDACNLADIGFVGDQFTWYKSPKKKKIVRERLDRFLAANLEGLKVNKIKVRHLSIHYSDHWPLCLK